MFQSKTIKRTHVNDDSEQPNSKSFSFQPQPEDLSEKKLRLNSNVHLEGLVTRPNNALFTDQYSTQYITDKSKNLNLLGRVSQRSASTEEELLSHDSDNQEDSAGGPSVMNPYESMTKHDYEIEEARQLETLEIFAKDFKQKRIKLGYTQGDVGLAIGQLSGNDFSQTTISRFEALNLSFKNMCKLRPLLEKWLNYANKMVKKAEGGEMVEVPIDPSITPGRKRKKRTSIDQKRRGVLDDMFTKNPKPTSDELHNIAEECGLDKEVVRVWFCNRRQKEKRIAMHEQQTKEDADSHSSPDSPRATMYPPVRIVPDTQGNFANFVSSTNSSVSNHLARAGPPSMLGESQSSESQKQQEQTQEQNFHALRFAGIPLLQPGNHLTQVRGLNPSLVFLRSAEAAQNSSHVSPAYSALQQEQYRKSIGVVSSAALQPNTSSLLSSFPSPLSLANHSSQDKAPMSSSSRLPSSVSLPP